MYLVFDVGGSSVKYAWMTADGKMEEKGKMPTRNKPGDGVAEFVDSIGEIYDQYRMKGEIEGIAMGLPGQIDVDSGIVYGGGALKYLDGVALGSLLAKRCNNVRISLENDGKCAALAEVWMGNAKDVQDACVLVFGTGVGGGIIKNRKIHRGNRLLAGELSYCISNMTRDDLKKITPVEQIELVEDSYRQLDFLFNAYAASGALVAKAAWAKNLPIEDVSGELIYRWEEEGDEVIHEILEDAYFTIAKECCNLYVTFDPDIILIGGGISAQPAFLEGIQRYVDKLKVITKVYAGIKLDVCKYRNDSNLLGALYNFKQIYNV